MPNHNQTKDFILVTAGTAIVAAAVFLFMLPSNLAVGSVSALAMVINNFIPLPVSLITLFFNIVLLILGYCIIGKDFALKTVYATIMLPAFLWIFEILLPDFQSLTQDPLLDMIGYIILVGVGLAILFSCNASTGGIEVVAKIMNKYLHMDLGQAMSLSGMLVAVSSALCYDSKTVFLSILGTYVGGMIVDYYIFGINIKRRVCIISQCPEKILNYILHDLKSGASLYDAIGAYDQKVRREIITIVDRAEYKSLMDYIRKTDPKAFVTVYSVSEISYQPKK
jgi:uncharacterized membrane-anchored protein YitT (DUF2179 family)